MSIVIRSAPRTDDELPISRVCKTSINEMETQILALVEVTVRGGIMQ